MLQAFLEAAPDHYKLIVAGPDEQGLWEGLEHRYLGEQAQRRRVIRVGLVTGQTKAMLLAGASLFALASEHENFGNTILESLAAGTPVLGSANVDLVSELAEQGMAFVAELNAEAWKEQLQSILQRPPAAEFARTARDWVADRYSWACIARRITAEYGKLT